MRKQADRIRDFRELHGCGLIEAARAIQRNDLRDEIRDARSVEALQAVLLRMLEMLP